MAGTDGAGATRAAHLHNEDHFLVSDSLGLYVVCDGASHRPAGELAASVATQAVEDFVERADADFGELLDAQPLSSSLAERAIRYAMAQVVAAGRDDDDARGMATTLTMLLVLGGRGVIGHLGDSRAYLVRGRRLHLLTSDHPLSEATRLEGGPDEPDDFEIESFAIDLELGDLIVLCTDGAVRALEDNATLIRNAIEISPAMLASRIVSAAHREHADQDATAIVARVHDRRGEISLSLSQSPSESRFGYAVSASPGRAAARARAKLRDDEDAASADAPAQERKH